MRSRISLLPQAHRESPELGALRARVRAFITAQLAAGGFTPGIDSWMDGHSPAFTAALAAEGWLGMTIPVEYGGHGRSFLERFVVTEELLAAGAPVAAHWIADRQAAPSLLKYGTEEQKRRYLPGIAAGQVFWAIGMSEPDSGSDLASVRTRGERADGGWRLTGTKVWTTGAHHARAFFVLARTEPLDAARRHAGLSQFIVELDSPGVQIRPIVSMDGSHHFNEVHLDGVFVPDGLVLGRLGEGWTQVTSELSYERSGPERFLSTYRLLAAMTPSADPSVGAYVARVTGLHQMSAAVAAGLERGENVATAAAVVKVLGTTLEGDIADLADRRTAPGDELAPIVARAVTHRPGFTLRGGTNEVLRGVIARELGLR
jgi:Acyl-CoA dehydrogenase, N-terminal domain/Acyl-CoA dehydrogenase, middle domain